VPASVLLNLDDASKTVLLDHVQAIATGFGVTDQVMPYELKAAQQYAQFVKIGEYAKFAVVICVAMVGLIFAQKRISQKYRARNHVEKVIRMSLAVCSGVAILTTIGIVMSMLSEALHFFHFVSPSTFFFGTEWNPGFSTTGSAEGSYGLLPLLWGTLMVSAIALLVSIPVGLMIAIYLAEYASPRLRAWAKPSIEILAGIPTIVYGVFALMVVGPFFKYLYKVLV
jgi:phosphate transport system permease protein